MNSVRAGAAAILALIFVCSLFPSLVTPDASDEQDRNGIDLSPSVRYPLGTDDLGRNRLTRLLTGARTSLLLAPAAALLSVAVASLIGVGAAFAGTSANRAFQMTADLTGSLPWLFILIALRACLPLDSPPVFTTAVTFAVLAVLGWAGPARVICNMTLNLQEKDFILLAHSLGVSPWRICLKYLLPNVRSAAAAQFWISIPAFILAEANLGLLGMGVAEPYSSLGNQLRELESFTTVAERPWLLAPAILLTVVVSAMWLINTEREQQKI